MKPIIYNINAFDATKAKTISFIWNGNQAFKNTCTIRNNTTNVIVYQQTQETLQLKHDIPTSALGNGILYNVTIKVFDKDNNVSEEATPVLFYCFSAPVFQISNIVENQVVQNSSFPVTLLYSQSEGEELQYYQLFLYNMNKNQIWSSGVKYDNNLSSTLSDLDDNGTYYVRATGITINGMELDTGYISFSVNYVMPSVYAIITLENKEKEGMIKIQSNILSLAGKFSGVGEQPTYINDEFIDLTNSSNVVTFNEGFKLENNFTLNIKGYDFKDFSTLLELSNGYRTIKLTKKKGRYQSEGDIEKVYFDLLIPSATSNYVIQSNFILPPNPTDILSIWIRRINHIYDLHIVNLSEGNI